jgi:iron complex outermembrane receptor protein
LQVRYIGHGAFESITAAQGTPVTAQLPPTDVNYKNTINNNSVASAAYLNLSASYDIGDHFSVFARIDNLLNKDPPIAPGGNGYPTNPVYFDTYGLVWKLGVRARF